MMDERSRCETYRSAGELVFVKKSCGFALQNPRIFFMAKRQIPLDAVLHRFRSRLLFFFISRHCEEQSDVAIHSYIFIFFLLIRNFPFHRKLSNSILPESFNCLITSTVSLCVQTFSPSSARVRAFMRSKSSASISSSE